MVERLRTKVMVLGLSRYYPTATTALNSGMSVVEISKLLGHERLDTTMIYAKTSVDAVKFGHQKHII